MRKPSSSEGQQIGPVARYFCACSMLMSGSSLFQLISTCSRPKGSSELLLRP
jgi:hypothetical protein